MKKQPQAAGAAAGKQREQFLAFVWVGAVELDLSRKSNDSHLIMHMAGQIPSEYIPENVMKAAKLFLAFCSAGLQGCAPLSGGSENDFLKVIWLYQSRN